MSLTTTSTKLRIAQLTDEVAALKRILNAYTSGSAFGPCAVTVTGADIDRKQAEEEACSEVETYDMQKPYEATGADYAAFHEAQRMRRDMNIARAGHKRLMHGCLETLYRRYMKYTKTINSLVGAGN